jgi:hypothetical protein
VTKVPKTKKVLSSSVVWQVSLKKRVVWQVASKLLKKKCREKMAKKKREREVWTK